MTGLRVLLVAPLAGIGGTELSTLSLAIGLRQAGHEVSVMCNPHPLVRDFASAGVRIVEATMGRNAQSLLKDAAAMRRSMADNQIEIIHFQSAFPVIMALLSRKAIRSGGVKAVWTCRGMKQASYPAVGHLFNYLIDFVIANCDAERERLVGNGLLPKRVRTVYNCPTTSVPEHSVRHSELANALGLSLDTPVVGTASRLRVERGVKYFIGAAAVISEQVPDTRFLIAGGGPEETKLREQARGLGIDGKVEFLGFRRDMDRIYPLMDVFVNPALMRCGTDNVNIEAMAFSKPLVVSDVGGGREIVHDGVTGFVVPPRDSPAMAEATLRLLRDKGLARRMGEAGRERILKDFTVQRLVREVEEVYFKVLEQAQGKRS